MESDLEALAEQVLGAADLLNFTVCTAESCTGGLVSSLLTDVEGLSHAFERGFAPYTEDAKVEQLGLDSELIQEHGVVSQAVAIAMADGALRCSRADISLAITGYAGPSEDENAQEGLVHIACAIRNRPPLHEKIELGAIGRTQVREAAARVGMHLLLRGLLESE